MKAYYLDIGNTSLRLAVPTENSWIVLWHQRHGDSFDKFLAMLSERSGDESYMIYVSSVRKDITRKLQESAPEVIIRELSTKQVPGHLLNYSTVQTLGIDRFLGCLGAHHKEETSVVVIDTGSACTVDFMDDAGVYQGGVIMPGIDILKKSMRRYLPELPDIQTNIPDVWPGKSTQESLQWGLNGAFKAAIEHWVHKYQMADKNAQVFITGGNSADVKKLLMPDTKLNHHPELHFEGMKVFVEEILSLPDNEF
jgi:type III pantothenate kinase